MYCEKNGCKEFGETFRLTAGATDAKLCPKHRRAFDAREDASSWREYLSVSADCMAAETALRKESGALQQFKDALLRRDDIERKNRESILAWLAAPDAA